MAWINLGAHEGDLQNEFIQVIIQNGWTLVGHFKKVAYPASWINPIVPKLDIVDIQFGCAEHFIFKSGDPQAPYFGIAMYGSMSIKYGLMTLATKPWIDVAPEDIDGTSGKRYRSQTGYTDLGNFITNLYSKSFKETHTVYLYMCENYPTELTLNDDVVIAWVDGSAEGLRRACLDIEVHDTGWDGVQGIYNFAIYDARPNYMQSPYVPIRMKIPTVTKQTEYGSVMGNLTTQNNWWYDSTVRMYGYVDNISINIIFQADKSAAYTRNTVPSIPLFIGKFISLDPADKGNYAISAGSALEDFDDNFDFDNPVNMNESVMCPLLKNYVAFPGDGVDRIMVYRGKFGARYQSHVLSWDAPPNLMPPSRQRSTDKAEYPQAWVSLPHIKEVKFNSSEYTEKVHTSRAYITHPEEGYRGYFPQFIVLPPMSIVEGDKLKVRKATCPDSFDVYRFYLTEAISPFSKIPGTPYRPAGIGIYFGEE